MARNLTGGQDGRGDESLDRQGDAARGQTSMGSVSGSPTWPNIAPDSVTTQAPPPVGLNWQTVAEKLGMDRRVLQHDAFIMVAGEYFPAAGYFFEPVTLQPRRVDVGDIALIHGYFVGQATLRQFNLTFPPGLGVKQGYRSVVPSPGRGQIIGLFSDSAEAARTRQRLLRGSLAAGIAVEEGPLGTELRVARPQQPGRVATVIAAHGGGVIAIDGVPVSQIPAPRGPIATGSGVPGEEGDAPRAGIGVAGDTQGPEIGSATEAERGRIEEFRRAQRGLQ